MGQQRIADVIFAERQDRCQLVAAPFKGNSEKPNIGDVFNQRFQHRIAALLDHLNRFGPTSAHGFAALTMKVPLAVATGGLLVSPSWAEARTKATLRVT